MMAHLFCITTRLSPFEYSWLSFSTKIAKHSSPSWYTEALIGWRVNLTLHHSSPPLHLIYFFRFYCIHQKISGGWREVKSGEEWVGTLHLPKPQCLSGFQAQRWRVKSKKEIRILYDASEENLIRQFLQYERTHRFLPRLGIILPCTRAISCQGEVKYEKRTLWQQVLG